MTQPHRGCCFAWVDTVMEGDMTETEGNSVDAFQKRGFGESVELSRKNFSSSPAGLCKLSHAYCASTMCSFSQSPVVKV